MEKEFTFLGVAEDTRPAEAKAKDWQYEETASAMPVMWQERTEGQGELFSRRDQNGSSSCMAQSGVKMLGIENFNEEGIYEELSATPIYQNRANKPAQGMWQQDCLSLLCKPLSCLESQVPSQKLSESQMDASYPITPEETATAEKYRAGGYAFIPVDIDKVASILAQKKGVQLMVFFMADEWWNQPNNTPTLIHTDLTNGDSRSLRHGICATDYFLLNGKKCLLIEDSAVTSSENGQRILTEDFFNARCFSAGYLLPLSNNHSIVNKPKYTFNHPIEFGNTGADVVALQNILKFEGFFSPLIPSTGYFGSISAQALKKWQIAHGIDDFANETNLTKIRVGSKTILELNKNYE